MIKDAAFACRGLRSLELQLSPQYNGFFSTVAQELAKPVSASAPISKTFILRVIGTIPFVWLPLTIHPIQIVKASLNVSG